MDSGGFRKADVVDRRFPGAAQHAEPEGAVAVFSAPATMTTNLVVERNPHAVRAFIGGRARLASGLPS